MSSTSLRNRKTRQIKAKRRIARPKLTRIQGNTAGVRKRLKKEAGKARNAAAPTAAATG